MKKIILLCLLLTAALSMNAQKSVCGVDFGTKYDKAEAILENIFGTKDQDSDDTTIYYYDKQYGDYSWNTLRFNFQQLQTERIFNECTLTKKFDTPEEASEFLDQLVKDLQSKYDNMIKSDVNRHGFNVYYGGKNPFDKNRRGFMIFAMKLSSGKYAVNISYGPYNMAVSR